MDGLEPGTIELITTRGTRRAPGAIILHRTTMLARRDWAEFKGFRVTGMARTLVDLPGVVDPETFETAAESAFMKNGNLYDELVVRLDELGAQGRNGITAVREFLANRDPNAAATESRLETRFLRLIRAAGLPEPTRQYVVSDGERFVTRLDFAYVPIRFGIRLNGKGTHLLPGQWQKDQTQGNDLALLAWTVLDFTWEDLAKRPEQVIVITRRAYEMLTSTSSTSPVGSRQSVL